MSKRLNLFVIIFLGVMLPALSAQRDEDLITYVWSFSMSTGEQDEITKSITEDFETAFLGTGCCALLQRRQYARLFEQQQSEQRISGSTELPQSRKKALESKSANAVFFGTIFDDVKSGQVKITVSLESLKSSFILKKKSVSMARYEYADPNKRLQKMEELVAELGWEVSGEPVDTEDDSRVKPKSKKKVVLDDCEYVIDACERSGNTVTVRLTITSKEVDTQLQFWHSGTIIYDNEGKDYTPSDIQIARSGNDALLVADVPVKVVISYTGVNKKATMFTLLYLSVHANQYDWKKVEFRNIPIQQ